MPDALKFLICIDEMRVWCVKSPTMTSVRKTLRVHEIKKEAGMKVFDKTWKLAVAGALVGVLAAFWKSGQYGDLYCVLRA